MTVLDQFQLWLSGYWPEWAAYITAALAGIIVILIFVLVMVIVFIYFERRMLGRFQIRLGPNRLGPEGIFQPIATAVKVLLKEDIVPSAADKVVHWLAPVIVFIPILLIFAVVPFQNGAILADLNVGIVYFVAISSVSAIGIYMAGWASNNKFALIAAVRTVAQLVSYEFPIVLSIVGVVLMTGSLSMTDIVQFQTIPLILMQPLGFLIFFIGAVAEMNRSPFDMLEADSEIVAGYHTEYSGMKFALFYLGEYGHALAYSAIISTLFLGGSAAPLLPPFIWLLIKIMAVFFVIVWMRSTLPRFRIDQLMAFAWKGLLPLAVFNLFLVAAEVLLMPSLSIIQLWITALINIPASAIFILLWSKFFTLGGGKVEV